MTDLAIHTDHGPQALRSGELIGSRYRLDAVAGTGGMATVWRAYDERLQRPVAIKVISDALANNPAAVARFAREARTHAGIQHPNLVKVYDYSVTAAQPYLVMEYIAGSTLAAELLSAIACVHDHGVLHRDIKPGNVLLDNDGHVRLTDFGLARLEDATQITRANEVVGTLRFLAPELIEGKQASKQSDLFALGVLLRTATEDTQAAGAQRLVEPPNPLRAEPPGGRLAKLITWLTQHDPKDRPRDAHAALAALPEKQPEQTRRRSARRGDEPTRVLSQTRWHRYSANQRLRSRTAAVSALLVAAAGTALVVIDAAGSGSGHARPAASARQTHSTGTVDQQLKQLASQVRRAATP